MYLVSLLISVPGTASTTNWSASAAGGFRTRGGGCGGDGVVGLKAEGGEEFLQVFTSAFITAYFTFGIQNQRFEPILALFTKVFKNRHLKLISLLIVGITL